MADDNKDLAEIAKTATEDFYELLNVAFDAPEPAIKKAYRKASIRYHPDKNPDNKNAADRFIYLGWARDILLNATLKGEYDRARARRREKVLQDDLLDGRRRQMKQDLERREADSRDFGASLKRKRAEDMSEAEKREQEIRRLAEDGKRRRKEAQERLEKKRREEEEGVEASFASPQQAPPVSTNTHAPEIHRTIKLRFTRNPSSTTTNWTRESIQALFSTYGPIDNVILGKDKKTRLSGSKHRTVTATAFVVYQRLDHAHKAVCDAVNDIKDVGLESVGWAGEAPDLGPKADLGTSVNGNESPSTPMATPKSFKASFGAKATPVGTGTGTPKFSFSPSTPSLQEKTMMRLKEAEKKRLEEQIRRREAEEDKTDA